MRESFPAALEAVLRHEGGFVDHPDDPGGATNRGITIGTFKNWRALKGEPAPSVADLRRISEEEVADIYVFQYWRPIWGDKLPAGVDYALFDFAVNSGPGRAVKFLQRIVGSTADGIMGANTLAAVQAYGAPGTLVDQLCTDRLAFLKRLRHWRSFGRGWTNRVEGVRSLGRAMAGSLEARPAPTPPIPAPSTRDEPVKASKTPEGKGLGIAGVGGLGAMATEAASRIEAFTELSDVILYAFVALTVAGVAFTAWRAIQRAQREQDA